MKRSTMRLTGTLAVFGGAGFIGSNFVREMLAKHPALRIVNVDLLTYSGNLENLRDIKRNRRYTFIKGDVASKRLVDRVMKKYRPEHIINFAAETHVDRSIHMGARKFIDTNILGVYTLLEATKRYRVKKFVQVSTDEVFGSLALDSKNAFNEASSFLPNVPYAATKAGGDLLCRAYYATWGVPVIVTHCSNNYGPYQYPEKIIPFFISRMLEEKKLTIYGDGKNVRDWIHVLDHCRALEFCLLRGTPGEVYNIGADTELNNLEITDMLLSFFKRDRSLIEFVSDRPGHDRRYSIDSSKIRRELGWKPCIPFKKGFRETVQWYIDNPKWIDTVRKKTGVFNPHIKR